MNNTMEKQYIAPTATAVLLAPSQILAGSDVSYGGSNTGTGHKTAESRSADFDWDDEEEDAWL